MGSTATLSVGKYDFLESKNYLESHFLFIYNMKDKKIEKYLGEDKVECTRYSYRSSIGKSKQCLDVLGYTLANLKKKFQEYRLELQFIFELEFEDNYREIYNSFTFEAWSSSLVKIAKQIITNGIDYNKLREQLDKFKKENDFIEYFIFNSIVGTDELYFGMPNSMDPWYIMRIIFENLPDETEVILDYTNLVDGGWYDPDIENESFCKQKIIIMTEGKSDSSIISKSLKLLYPHLYGYYYFMNFDISNAQGSTNFLTHYIKGFIGAGIDNKIIALFDNDAAAKSEMINLEKIDIPLNIRVLALPDTELANDYPTIGPYNNQNANINGLACSIELFFGKDILCNEKGELTPIIWKGYMERIKKYQGEITNKDIVQKKFFEVIEKIQNKSIPLSAHDWSTMEKLLQMIFNAFND